MNSARRYPVAALVAAFLTAGVALASGGDRSVALLAGIALVTFVGSLLVLADPAPYRARGETPNLAAGAFAGTATFGTLALLTGVEPSGDLGAAVLGLVLAWTGFVAGVAHERE